MKILIEESVLRQALYELCTQRDAHYSGDYPTELRDAITALRTALEAAEKSEPVAWVAPIAIEVSSGKCSASAWSGVKTNSHTIPLYTHPAPAIPDGWCLMPKEPTEEMIDAADESLFYGKALSELYKAMLAAAPKPEESK